MTQADPLLAVPPSALPGSPAPAADLADVVRLARDVVAGVERVVRGQHAAVRTCVAAVLAGGHVLLEDVPGSGKTTLARALARTLGCSFGRVQATADLLPADITGSGVWHPGTGTFTFAPGPLFAHVVLVDELNRTSPRTQSAFLEAMEEGAVTVDGVRHRLPDPFVLVATQNPVEQHGTFPLPESQLDRFAVTLRLGELGPRDEQLVLREQLRRATVEDLPAVTDAAGLKALRTAVRDVHVSDAVLEHASALVRATRTDPRVLLGASPRAALALLHCAQAHALLDGRGFVRPDDVKALAPAVLAHRLLTDGPVPSRDAARAVVLDVVARTPVPLTS